MLYIALALALAAIAPVALIATRYELQRVRTSIIEDLRHTIFKSDSDNSQLDLVQSRYIASARRGAIGGRQTAVMAWTGAFFFTLVCFTGFLLLFVPVDYLFAASAGASLHIVPGLFWTTTMEGRQASLMTCSIAGFGFLGGYIFQVRYLTRATLNQELSALAFVRSAIGIIVGTLLATVFYRAVGVASVPAELTTHGSDELKFGLALGIAFAVGYWPDVGLARIAHWLRIKAKVVDTDAVERAKILPPEVVDGIDTEISFRLQESGLYDIQNLATAHPLTLYAETPYNIYQCFDWVLQAQLILSVGSECYSALRRHNIRTIFDLERAILANGAPEGYLKAIGAVLLASADAEFKERIGLPANGPVTIDTLVVRHVVAILGDDLHVHRLRDLWSTIRKETSDKTRTSDWLYETGPLPGEDSDPFDGISSAAAAAIRVAAHLGQAYLAEHAGAGDAAKLAALRDSCVQQVRLAIGFDPKAKEYFRLLYNPAYLRKKPGETSLEIFLGDSAFATLLA